MEQLARLQTVVSEAEDRAIRRAAANRRLSVSRYIRSIVVPHAERAAQGDETFFASSAPSVEHIRHHSFSKTPACPTCGEQMEYEAKLYKERLDPADNNSPARWRAGFVCRSEAHDEPVSIEVA
jgi:hypothetical protein